MPNINFRISRTFTYNYYYEALAFEHIGQLWIAGFDILVLIIDWGDDRKERTSVYTAKQVTVQKANGAHFTPHGLAHFVAQRIIKAISFNSVSSLKILDPACGDGELLLAFAEILPSAYLNKSILMGVESDSQALNKVRQRFEKIPTKALELENNDFLELCKKQLLQPRLFDNVPTFNSLTEGVDVIIANPPYVRTQVLGSVKAQELTTAFGLTGRVDLYHAFLIAMTHCLAPGGIIGVITSNRFLSTQGGATIRAFMAHHYEIIELFDLGDTKLFDAAVLPAVFIGRKRSGAQDAQSPVRREARFVRIYERPKERTCAASDQRQSNSIYAVLEDAHDGTYSIAGQSFKVATGILSLPSSPTEPWSMTTSNENAWLETIQDRTRFRINDIAKVRVGIKTTADDVFIRKDWSKLPESIRPEEQLLRHLLSHDDAKRWTPNTAVSSLRQVLYTHTVQHGKRLAIDLAQYPRAAAYFEQHRSRLESRTYVLEANRHWYEIWVPQNPLLWEQPKLVFPDISPEPKFFYDDAGHIVDGNCYWIVPNANQSPDILFLIAGIANSNLMTRYHDLVFNNKLYAGRRRYLTQYVEKYPVPDTATNVCKDIVVLVKELLFSSTSDTLQKRRERELEVLVAQAFGVEPILDI